MSPAAPAADPSGIPRCALLGLGKMGAAMGARLRAAGCPLTVWNRTAARAEPLAAAGARVAADPADAVRDADVVLLVLADGAASEAALAAAGAALRSGTLVVDLGTIGPEAARRSAARVAAAGGRYCDAPVLGSVPAVRAGTLTVLAGGDTADLARARVALDAFAARVVHAGGVGSGNVLKLAMNLLVGGLTELLAEATLLAERAGVDAATVRTAVEASVLRSPFLDYKGPQLFDRAFHPALATVSMLRKDLDLVLDLGVAVGAPLPATNVVRAAYRDAEHAGHGDADFAAVLAALEGAAVARDERQRPGVAPHDG